MLWQGTHPATAVYDSIGDEFFLAPAPGWLNLGYWEGPGTEEEAPRAVRRLVERLAGELPRGSVILDVGNGLAAQDPVIAEVAQSERLYALNITMSQLRAGAESLALSGARAIRGDAARLPLADASVDGVISVEAAFHFSSRERFFAEARRVLRPGGVLTMSDVPTERMPRTPTELYSAIGQLRLWALRPSAAKSTGEIVRLVERAGFTDVRVELCAEKVIDPAYRLVHERLRLVHDVPISHVIGCRILLDQVRILRERGIIDYLLLRATAA
jgi:ubiquinone/menaquinone biosynthesis C-methylase UbiE